MTGMSVFADYFVVGGREDGLDQIEIHSYDPAVPPRRIAFPEASYAAGLGSNPEYACPTLRLGYESMVTPGTVYDYHVASGTLTTLKVQAIPSGYDAAHYATERPTIDARDWTEGPASFVSPRGRSEERRVGKECVRLC